MNIKPIKVLGMKMAKFHKVSRAKQNLRFIRNYDASYTDRRPHYLGLPIEYIYPTQVIWKKL